MSIFCINSDDTTKYEKSPCWTYQNGHNGSMEEMSTY